MHIKQFLSVRVWEWKSKSRHTMHEREIQIFKSEIYEKKKKNTKMPCFYLNYVEVGKRRSSVLGLLNDFLF